MRMTIKSWLWRYRWYRRAVVRRGLRTLERANA
jgi:hypothetical protein